MLNLQRNGAVGFIDWLDLSVRAGCKIRCVKYSEIIARNLSKSGWSWGCVSAVDSQGRTIGIADAHRNDGKRFVVRANEKLTTFVELEWKLGPRKESGFARLVCARQQFVAGREKNLNELASESDRVE